MLRKLAILCFWIVLAPPGTGALTLFDVDFNAETLGSGAGVHPFGSPFPRTLLSGRNFLEDIVVASVGSAPTGLMDKPLSVGSGTSVGLRVEAAFSRYLLTVDLLLDPEPVPAGTSPQPSFTVLIRTPTAANPTLQKEIWFFPGVQAVTLPGTNIVVVPAEAPSVFFTGLPPLTIPSAYTAGEAFTLSILTDFALGQQSVSIDDQLLATRTLAGDDIQLINFNARSGANNVVALDNILLVAVPEPTLGLLAAVATSAIVAYGRGTPWPARRRTDG